MRKEEIEEMTKKGQKAAKAKSKALKKFKK
jgi:hypothetical protein